MRFTIHLRKFANGDFSELAIGTGWFEKFVKSTLDKHWEIERDLFMEAPGILDGSQNCTNRLSMDYLEFENTVEKNGEIMELM